MKAGIRGFSLLPEAKCTDLWLLVNLGVHLGANEGKQAHSVSLSEQVLPAVGHVQGLLLHYLSGHEGGSSESQRLLQGTV